MNWLKTIWRRFVRAFAWREKRAVWCGATLSERTLIENWFRNVRNPDATDTYLWVCVKHAFAVGRGRAYEICRAYGYDPDTKVPGAIQDGLCSTCGSWFCPDCEKLSHIPEGCEPRCDHCDGEEGETDEEGDVLAAGAAADRDGVRQAPAATAALDVRPDSSAD